MNPFPNSDPYFADENFVYSTHFVNLLKLFEISTF